MCVSLLRLPLSGEIPAESRRISMEALFRLQNYAESVRNMLKKRLKY